MRRFSRVLPLVASVLTVALSACAGHGISLGPAGGPQDPALLLSCARSVASERGLTQVTQSNADMEIEAKSAVNTHADAVPSYDVLTVKLSPAKQGLRMLVSSATYAVRSLRAGVGSSAAKSDVVVLKPSEHVALVRDAVLTQCGTLGN